MVNQKAGVIFREYLGILLWLLTRTGLRAELYLNQGLPAAQRLWIQWPCAQLSVHHQAPGTTLIL